MVLLSLLFSSILLSTCQSEQDPVLEFEDSAYFQNSGHVHGVIDSSSFSSLPLSSKNSHWWWFDDNGNSNNSNVSNDSNNNNEYLTMSHDLRNDYPCQPRNIHLSLGDTPATTATTTAMRLSFSLPNRLDSFCHPDQVNVQIEYAKLLMRKENSQSRQWQPLLQEYNHDHVFDNASTTTSTVMDICVMREEHENNKNSWRRYHSANNNNNNNNDNNNDDGVVIRQYDTTSPITQERYSSDFIYHVALDDLQGNSEYVYTISVQSRTRTSSNRDDCRIEKRKKRYSTNYDGDGHGHGRGNGHGNGHGDDKRIFTTATTTKSHHLRGSSGKSATTHEMNVNNHEQDLIRLERRNLMENHFFWNTNNAAAARTYPVVFTTPPTMDSISTTPVKFAIVGDLGQTYNSTVTMLHILSSTMKRHRQMPRHRQIQRQRQKSEKMSTKNDNGSHFHSQTPVTALLIAGDMSYANSIQPQWDNWFNLIQPIASKIPMMVAVGNHEIECDAETFVPFLAYENRFYMPNRIDEAQVDAVDDKYKSGPWGCATPSEFIGKYDYGNAYYSFEYGMMKTIVLSSYSDTRQGSPQYNWLVEELKRVVRDKHPWLMVMMHTQFYTTFQAHNNEEQTIIMREAMEELFLVYKVNFVFSGHDHAYMRSKPTFRGQVVENGKAPIYMIVGEGGNREGHVKNYLNETPEEWVAVRDKTVYGFGTLEVFNSTLAQWKWNMGGLEGSADEFNDAVFFTNQYFV